MHKMKAYIKLQMLCTVVTLKVLSCLNKSLTMQTHMQSTSVPICFPLVEEKMYSALQKVDCILWTEDLNHAPGFDINLSTCT
jgi:hypothetical protein